MLKHCAPLLLLPLTLSCAQAGEAELARLLQILRDNGTITDAQYQDLIGAMAAPSPDPAPLSDLELLDRADESAPVAETVDTGEGGIEAASYDGASSFELGGRIQIDAARFSIEGMGDEAELRRVRLDAKGSFYGDYEYELGLDFADDEVEVKDATVSYLGWFPLRLTVGQFKQPFSLEEQTSSRHITFMERALPNELAPGRAVGVGLKHTGRDWTLAGGLFAEDLNKEADNEVGEGWGITGRATYAPWHTDTRALHLGLSLAHRNFNHGDFLRFETKPESHPSRAEFLDTGKDDIEAAEALDRAALELAGVWGPLSLQGEYLMASVSQRDGEPDLDFEGWYLQGSWLLTGESRKYRLDQGDFGRVRPRAAGGAWELAARYSTLNLNAEPIEGGEQSNFTLGVNWYIQPHLKLMANYIWTDLDEIAADNEDLDPDDDPRILQMRMQVDF